MTLSMSKSVKKIKQAKSLNTELVLLKFFSVFSDNLKNTPLWRHKEGRNELGAIFCNLHWKKNCLKGERYFRYFNNLCNRPGPRCPHVFHHY